MTARARSAGAAVRHRARTARTAGLPPLWKESMLTTSRPRRPTPAPDRPGSDLARLTSRIRRELAPALDALTWAEDEIGRAARRHPAHADTL